jgi:hypothetical protein
MIKIEIDQKKRQKIDSLHEEYIKKIVVPRLEEKIEKGKDVEFLKKFFGNTEKVRNNKIIEICLSDDLEKIKDEFDKKFAECYGFEFICPKTRNQKEIYADADRIKNILDKVLNYTVFNTGSLLKNGKKWNRHKLITSLGVKVCPYCNRQYITSYENDIGDEKTTADVDHYYPKANYPILQMNIYNMIPSCNVCNSKTKLDNNKRHLYPYKDPSNSLIFEIPLDIVDDYVKASVTKIKIDTRNNEKAKVSNEVFKLGKIYQAHLDIATEIKRNTIEYLNIVNRENSDLNCEEYYKKTMGIKIPWSETIYNRWFGFMSKDLLTEPLLKLKQDIFNQMMKTQKE